MTKSDDEKKKEKTETARDERGTNAIEARRVSAFGKRGQRRVRGLVAGGRRPVRGRRVSRMVSRSKNLPAPPPHPPRRGTAQILLTRSASDPSEGVLRSESTSRGFDRARERHGESAGRAVACGVPMMAAPLYDMMDMAIEFRRDRSPLRARVSSDASSLGFFKTTVKTNTRRHFSFQMPQFRCASSSAFLAAASHLPAPAGATRWRPRRPSRPPTRASRVESRSSVSRPASARRGAPRGVARRRREAARADAGFFLSIRRRVR
jgi:hypothetical protein